MADVRSFYNVLPSAEYESVVILTSFSWSRSDHDPKLRINKDVAQKKSYFLLVKIRFIWVGIILKYAQPLFVLHDRNHEIKEIMIGPLILSKNTVDPKLWIMIASWS